MKRGYIVSGGDLAWGISVVASTAKKAKQLAWAGWEFELDCDWIDLRVQWRREATVSDLPFGIVEDEMVAYRHKLIDYIHH